MKKTRKKYNILRGRFFILTLFFIASLLFVSFVKEITSFVLGLGENQLVYAKADVCPHDDGWIKYEFKDSDKEISHDAGGGNYISQVCVFGGGVQEMFLEDGTKSCWQVTGIGTRVATASETWPDDDKNSSCKDISHVSFKVDPALTLTPTLSPTPTLTPSPIPSLTLTLTPTPSPSATPSLTPSPTPSLTPTPSPTVTPTPEPTGQITPEAASTEKTTAIGGIVLSADTLAETGAFSDNLYALVLGFGFLFSALGVRQIFALKTQKITK